MNEKFFMVYAEGKEAPVRKHTELLDAEKEAKRISRKEGVDCYVLEMVSIIPKANPITWNKKRKGVEIRAEGMEFFIPDMPNCLADWEDAKMICKAFGGKLPNRKQLEYIAKNITDINELLEANKCHPLPLSWLWSDEEHSASYAWRVRMRHGFVGNDCKSYRNYVRAVSAL